MQLVWRRIKNAGLQVVYEKDDKFNALMRRCAALPFVKKEDFDAAFAVFETRKDALESEKLRVFSASLITYLNDQWRHGVFATQDWNLYDINLMLVPSTNNGNEGQNRRFKENFGIHPKIWQFFLTLDDELQSCSADIPAILFGSLIPEPDERYAALKEEREIAKANYEAGLLDIDQYLGRIGGLSLHAGKAKVNSDDAPGAKENVNNKRKLPDPNTGATKKKRTEPARVGQRGRPVVHSFRQSSQDDADHPSNLPTPPIVSSSSDQPPAGGGDRYTTPTDSGSRPSSNLPWPARSGSGTTSSRYMPSTACRMTSSAESLDAVQPRSSSSSRLHRVNISVAYSSNNSLIQHISDHNLGLRARPDILGDGNCWYRANVDLISQHNLSAPRDHIILRKAVANAILGHSQKRNWIRALFGGKTRDFNKFVKEQSKPGVFIDNSGIPVVATADYLNVVFHIVGTSNNHQNPVTVIGEGEGRKVFHIGYFQDNSDVVSSSSSRFRVGHYQSLEIVPGAAVPCCGISKPSAEPRVGTKDSSVVDRIKAEEKILEILHDDGHIVGSSLKRLLELNMSVEDLFRTKICNILTLPENQASLLYFY